MEPSPGSKRHRQAGLPFPEDPEFYRRVLNYVPTPIVVLNGHGEFVYVNQAMLTLSGWDPTPESPIGFLDYIHPDDRDRLAREYMEIVQSPGARILGGRPWAEMHFRIITADGTTIPVAIVGSGGLFDPTVGGVIYEVRPAHTRNLLGRVLDGLSRGSSMLHLLSLVGEMIASSPLDLEAAILQSAPGGGLMLAASTSSELSDVLRGNHPNAPWEHLAREPQLVEPSDLPSPMRERFKDSVFQDLWHVAVESPLTSNTLRIVAASPTHHVPANGPKNRLVQARELAAAVLLRTQADVLLAHAADHDALTELPNRAAFYQLADLLDPMVERAALHLDLDGLKAVNDAHGQACGDAVLQILADRLRVTGSRSNIIGRLGDDEFAILLEPNEDEGPIIERALQLASRVLAAVNETIIVGGRPLTVSASVGVAFVPPGLSTDHLLTWADAAMHDAKAAGGGQIHRFGTAQD